jgi:hypothetical protein
MIDEKSGGACWQKQVHQTHDSMNASDDPFVWLLASAHSLGLSASPQYRSTVMVAHLHRAGDANLPKSWFQ